MKINGNIMRTSVLAVITGTVLTIVVISSIFILPAILDNTGPGEPGPGDIDGFDLTKIGGRVAKFMDSRSNDVVFSWIYNNSFVNLNLSDAFGFFVDGVIISGAPVNDSTTSTNISVVHEPVAETADITSNDLNQVVGGLINVIGDLDSESTGHDFNSIFPPNILWEIAFNDSTALAIIYNDNLNVMAVINGTWEYSGHIIHGVDFPHFDYANGFDDAVYMSLDSESESLIQTAFVNLKDLIVTAFD